MRLAAIYCVWDDWAMFKSSYINIRPLVDGVILIASTVSNFGEQSLIGQDIERLKMYDNFDMSIINPSLNTSPTDNERNKRNYGLNRAKDLGYTHFLMMDADEFYEPEPFLKEKERFKKTDLHGLVCGSQVYFKSPDLTIGMDTTRVTFIHKITPSIRFEFNRKYPFAWDNGAIRIDPTRQLNINSCVEWSNIIMRHYSWIRKDYDKKIRNSTARSNIERSTILEDLKNAAPGYFCKFYQKELIACDDIFGLGKF